MHRKGRTRNPQPSDLRKRRHARTGPTRSKACVGLQTGAPPTPGWAGSIPVRLRSWPLTEQPDYKTGRTTSRVLGFVVCPRRSKAPPPTVVALHALDGVPVRVDPGVFVPRPHTQALAWRAVSLLPALGIAVDLCTGIGAVAAVLGSAHPRATVVATDVDLVAVACARRNGVRAIVAISTSRCRRRCAPRRRHDGRGPLRTQ